MLVLPTQPLLVFSTTPPSVVLLLQSLIDMAGGLSLRAGDGLSESMTTKRTCLLVLGMHRSGTSALTRVLSLLGAGLPGDLMPANESNPRGYWEPGELVKLNDDLLAEAGSRWDDWNALDESAVSSDVLAAYEEKIGAIIRSEMGERRLLVLKDPRISRMLPLYRRVLESLKYELWCVLAYRKPMEVARSLEVRDGLSMDVSALLWLRYTLDAELESKNCPRFLVSYDRLITASFDTVEALAHWGGAIGLSSDVATVAEAAGTLQPSLRHFAEPAGHSEVVAAANPMAVASEVYDAMEALACEAGAAEALAVLKGIRGGLNAASGLFSREECLSLNAELSELSRTVLEQPDTTLDANMAALYGAAKTLRATHIMVMAATRAEIETLKASHAAALQAAQDENQWLRGELTKTLCKPFVTFRDYLRYLAEHRIADWLAAMGSAASTRYAGYAAKRNPKRYQEANIPERREGLAAAPGVELPSAVTHSIGGDPVVVLPFEEPLLDERPAMRIAVVLHLYYLDQAGDFLTALQSIPQPFALFISTDSEAKATALREVFSSGPARHTEVRVMPNRGRDIAPKLLGFADVYDEFDLLLFLHSKASMHTREQLEGWRDYLLKALLGSTGAVDSIIEAFALAPELGMVAPPNFPLIRDSTGWLVNFPEAQKLGQKMGLSLSIDSRLDFPAGSMFWARPLALRALLDAGIRLEDFPPEPIPSDGTIANAIERLFFYSCELAGRRWIRAAQSDQLTVGDHPLRVGNVQDLEWALSDQMPALLLEGRCPRSMFEEPAEARLDRVKGDFRRQCRLDLEAFLSSEERLVFELPEGQAKLSVIVVLFNQAELTYHCLRALQRNAGQPLELIIFDNQSSDETSALLERLDGAVILKSPENLHFLRGVNCAAKQASGEYLLLLNNDARVLPGTIASAMARLDEDPSIGAVGGPIILLDGTLQEAGSIVFSDGSCLGYGRGRDPGEAEFRFRRDVDYCSGAFLMLRRSLWEALGGFDEAFIPAYYEETDLCLRIWASGSRVVYEPDAGVVHFEFGSSSDRSDAIALQQTSAEVFRSKHAAVLSAQHFPSAVPPILARQRRDRVARILVIDDRVPISSYGSGYPRAAKFLNAMGELGCSVTLFPTAMPYFSCGNAYKELPRTTELILGEPFTALVDFLNARRGCFDVVFVSRPHNMSRFRQALAQVSGWEAMPVFYDAEAIFAERDTALAGIRGEVGFDADCALKAELALTNGTRTIFSVSPSEAAIFREYGHTDVRILSHAVLPNVLGSGPEERRNFLFVGALDNDFSPNTDSLDWFVREVMPRIDTAMGSNWCLDVVGRCGANSIKHLRGPRVRFHGRIENVDAYYASARVFVAPTRFAAGIPLKVLEAASVGLPVVATELLVKQLAWTDGDALLAAADADAFAAACVRLYKDDALWHRVRSGGLAAVQRDFSPDAFRKSLGDALRRIV